MIEMECPKDLCTLDVDQDGSKFGELRFSVFQDSDGDPNVINGVRHWWDAELISQTCTCQYSDEEMDKLIQDAVERATTEY